MGLLAGYRMWRRLQAYVFTQACRGEFYRIGRRSSINLPVRLSGEARISLGEHVFIGSNSWLQVVAHDGQSNEPVIVIGDHTSVSGFLTITAAQNVLIGASVLIARYVYISDHTHAISSRERAIKDQGITKVAPVHIREGAWIGQGVVVCPGVTIGRNAVIGANSIVRHDVPDFCVAAGAPARVIRCIDEASSKR